MIAQRLLNGFRYGKNAHVVLPTKDLEKIDRIIDLVDRIGMYFSQISDEGQRKINEKLEHPHSDFKRFLDASIGQRLLYTHYEIQDSTVSLKVDWQSVNLCAQSKIVWRARNGADAPNTAHAEAPGPFGRFLQAILDHHYQHLKPTSPPPSARSALRALNNVTSSGIKSRLLW